MDKRLKFFIIAIIGISSFIILLIANFSLYSNPNTSSKESVNNISLIVDYNNGTIKNHENFTLNNWKITAFDALDKWCDIKTIDYVWGVFVSDIDGVSGNWIYMVNNNTPYVSAQNYQLNDGDEVKWLIGTIF
ncbi:MAG: DUF4430 domain-containing protein [Candidatus Odinarchaeota archaeon]